MNTRIELKAFGGCRRSDCQHHRGRGRKAKYRVHAEPIEWAGTESTTLAGHYALAQTALLPAQLVHLIAIAAWLPLWPELAYAAYLRVATVALGLLLSPELRWRRVGLALEAGRLLLSVAVALTGEWFGQLVLPVWAAWAIAAIAAGSLLAMLVANLRMDASGIVGARRA